MSVTATLIGLVVMFGWFTNNTGLIQIFPSLAPMQFNTALCFVMCGITLYFTDRKLLLITSIFPTIVLLLSSLTLLQYTTEIDLHIDQVFVSAEHITTKTLYPGRMSAITAITFFITASCFFLSRCPQIVFGIAITIICLAVSSIFSNLFQFDSLLGLGSLQQMAIHTSTCFILLAIGLASSCLRNERKVFSNATPFFIFFFSLTITILVTYNVKEIIRNDNKLYFDKLVSDSEHEIRIRLKIYEQALWGGVGLFNASNFVDRNEWKAFISSIDIKQNLPGINGIGYIDNVKRAELTEYIAKTKEDNAPDFINHPITSFDDKFIIKYIEPEITNRQAVGLDIGFEKNRRAAAELSRDTGLASLTRKIELVQDHQNTPGFLLLLPLFSSGFIPSTVEERRAELLGWIYAPFIGKNFLSDIRDVSNRQLNFKVYDGVRASANALIYQSEGKAGSWIELPAFSKITELSLMNDSTKWTIEWQTSAIFDPPSSSTPTLIIFITGCILSLLLAGVVHLLLTLYGSKTKELRDSEERLSITLEGGDIGLWDWNIETGKVVYSKGWAAMLGYTLEELAPTLSTWEELIHPDDLSSVKRNIQAYLSGAIETYETEFRMQHKNGSWCWILARGKIDEWNNRGKPLRIIGTHTDITNRKQAEDKLENRAVMLELAEKTANLGHWHISLQNNTLFWSRQIFEIHGVTPDEYTPTLSSAINFYHPDDREHVTKIINQSIQDRSPFSFQFRIIRKDGKIIYVESHGRPEFDEKNNVIGVFGVSQNVTNQKEYEQTIEKANRAKSDFLANMSHEIRTPMNGILGTINLISDVELNDKQRKYINIIRNSSLMLLQILNEILDFSKIEAGRFELHLATMKLDQAIEEQITLLHPLAQEKSLNFNLNYDPNLPQYIIADELRIKQIINNLVSNALKFTSSGSINVDVKPGNHANEVIFSVIDSGVGIPADKLDNIFLSFTQIQSATGQKTQGTGLGLAISKHLAGMMGGKIGVESVEGKGSTFWFTITYDIPSAEQIEAYNKSNEGTVTENLLFEADVLVVEDVLTNQFIMGSFLEKLGCKTDFANNGVEAVNMVQQKAYDLVFMDCQMPVMNGYLATEAIRKLGMHTLPIIALTANALQSDKEKCAESGMNDFASKPVDFNALTALLEKWLTNKKSEKS